MYEYRWHSCEVPEEVVESPFEKHIADFCQLHFPQGWIARFTIGDVCVRNEVRAEGEGGDYLWIDTPQLKKEINK